MSMGNIHGVLESGFVDFSGESSKIVTLSKAKKTAFTSINLFVHETQNTGAAPNVNTDVPSINVANIQASSSWQPDGKSFILSLSASLNGRVHWYVIESK